MKARLWHKQWKMAAEDSRDIANDSHSLLELEIASDGAMRPFMFEP